MKTKIYIPIFFSILTISIAFSQERTAIRAVGMGRTAVATSRGTEAIGINPANIAIPGERRFNLNVFSLGFRVGSDFLNYGVYQDYFTGAKDSNGNVKKDINGKSLPYYLTAADKQVLLDQFTGEVQHIRFNFDAQIFGLTYQDSTFGGLGLSVNVRAGGDVGLDKEFLRMVLFNFDSTGSVYEFKGSGATAYLYHEYTLTYGRRLPLKFAIPKDVYVGFGVKYIQGWGYAETQNLYAKLGTSPDPIMADQYMMQAELAYKLRRSGVDLLDPEVQNPKENGLTNPAGGGVGFDVGVSSKIIDGLRVGASIIDIGQIEWKKHIIVSSGGDTISNITDYMAVSTKFDSVKTGTNEPGDPFKTKLPTMWRLGAEIRSKEFVYTKWIPGNLLLAVEFSAGMNTSMGNSTNLRFSSGLEWRIIPIIPLRFGFSTGGDLGGTYLSFGSGLDLEYLSWDFATENFGILFIPRSFKQISFTTGLKIKF
jgi:hypothetical protein